MQCSHPNHSSWHSSHCLTAESAHRLCEFSLQTIPALVHDAFRISFVGKLQTTAAENIFQQRLVDLYLIKHLLNAREIFMPQAFQKRLGGHESVLTVRLQDVDLRARKARFLSRRTRELFVPNRLGARPLRKFAAVQQIS